jgi:hypothetical protein
MRQGLAKEKTPGLGDELRPFIIHDVFRPGKYKIRYKDGRVVTNAWNIPTPVLPLSKRFMLVCQ